MEEAGRGTCDTGRGGSASGADRDPVPRLRPPQWPRLLSVDEASGHLGEGLHLWGAWAIALVMGPHVAAVVWHQPVERDAVLARMWPRAR